MMVFLFKSSNSCTIFNRTFHNWMFDDAQWAQNGKIVALLSQRLISMVFKNISSLGRPPRDSPFWKNFRKIGGFEVKTEVFLNCAHIFSDFIQLCLMTIMPQNPIYGSNTPGMHYVWFSWFWSYLKMSKNILMWLHDYLKD